MITALPWEKCQAHQKYDLSILHGFASISVIHETSHISSHKSWPQRMFLKTTYICLYDLDFNVGPSIFIYINYPEMSCMSQVFLTTTSFSSWKIFFPPRRVQKGFLSLKCAALISWHIINFYVLIWVIFYNFGNWEVWICTQLFVHQCLFSSGIHLLAARRIFLWVSCALNDFWKYEMLKKNSIFFFTNFSTPLTSAEFGFDLSVEYASRQNGEIKTTAFYYSEE